MWTILKYLFALYMVCLVFSLLGALFDFIYENSPFVALIEYIYPDARDFLILETVVGVILVLYHCSKNAPPPSN